MHMQRIGGKVVGGGARRRRWAAACLFLLCAPGFWGYAACSHAGAAEGRIRLKTRASASEGGVGVGEEGTNTRADAPGGTDESWRDKAAERLGLVRSGNRLNLGPGSEAALTASRSARAGGKTGEKARAGQTTTALPNSVCNITIACHVCPEAAMRDNADYCLSTGWRHQLRCVNEEGVEVEVRFESCKSVLVRLIAASSIGLF